MNRVVSSECMTVFTSFTRASFLNMWADQSSSWLIRTSHFVTNLPYYSLILGHFLKFCCHRLCAQVTAVADVLKSCGAF